MRRSIYCQVPKLAAQFRNQKSQGEFLLYKPNKKRLVNTEPMLSPFTYGMFYFHENEHWRYLSYKSSRQVNFSILFAIVPNTWFSLRAVINGNGISFHKTDIPFGEVCKYSHNIALFLGLKMSFTTISVTGRFVALNIQPNCY